MELEFVDQEITAYGGLAILKQMLTQSGFVSEIEMVANFWLRSGDAHIANNFKAFLEETLSFFGSKKIGLLRLDSGFYDKNIFDFLEQKDVSIDYIVAVPMYVTIQRKIAVQHTWLYIEDGEPRWI